MDFDRMYPSKFLRAEDLGDKVARVTIQSVEMGKMQDGSSKPIMSFVGREKQLVLNKTNGKKIAGTYGKSTEKWVGKEIQLFASETDFAGDTVPCIRVKIPATAEGKERIPTAKPPPEPKPEPVEIDEDGGGYERPHYKSEAELDDDIPF